MTTNFPIDDQMPDEALEAYLRLCQDIYQTMEREGRWPWPDSQNPEDLLESKDP